jgi:ubiquinone/menaquinone biosynthesis C-methylase UbiE
MVAIFDRERLKYNRDKIIDNIAESLLFQRSAEDIIQRLSIIDKKFNHILDLGCHAGQLTNLLARTYSDATITVTNSSATMLQFFEHDRKLLVDEEEILFEPIFEANSFDLITFSLGLHWINDVQNLLLRVKRILKPSGIFIGNFIGGNSLKALSKKFIEAEIATNHPHYQRISPFINFDHVTPLLSQAGFIEIIVDHQLVQLDYNSPLEFIKELKNIGQSGALIKSHHHSISKQIFAILSNNTDIFTEQINIISFIAALGKNIKLVDATYTKLL